MKERQDLLTLLDGEGEEVQFELLDRVPYMGSEFLILLPQEYRSQGKVAILYVEEEQAGDQHEKYTLVEDEGTLNAVYGQFRVRCRDQFNFID